jgi:predicted O-linked N-acetylglucosamine transferase (SPINDLY family)
VRQIEHAMIAYRQAIKLNPRLAETYSSLGIALKEAGRFDEAVAVLRQAIAIKPEYADAHVNLGGVLQDIGELDEAFAEHRHAVALAPNLVEAHSNLVCALQYHPGYDAAAIASEARAWNQRHAEPLRSCIRPHGNDRNPERRLRIGYVSPDFWDHVVGRNLLPLLANHDKKPFEIFAYSLVKIPDARTNQLRGFTDHWRSIVGMPDDQVADQIRADGIDILVDLALHTAKNRLLIFARKPAPVQVTFAGYPGSTGLTTMDYRLSDPYLDPPGSEFRSENGADQAIYSEQTVRLPDSFWCYDPVDDRDISVGALPAIETGAITFGCLNTFHKVSDPALTFWARIIAAVKGSRLLLMAPAGTARTRVVNLMSRQGLDPDRIEFVPRQSRRNYLETYHRIDIGLDTFPYNGHTTSLDSFWMGVPVVTLLGETVVSRAGWCQLSNLGLKELAGRSPDEFVRIAVELAGDLPRLKEIRATLRQRMEASPLMDAPRFARNIESAYRGMWREWCSKAQGVIPAG